MTTKLNKSLSNLQATFALQDWKIDGDIEMSHIPGILLNLLLQDYVLTTLLHKHLLILVLITRRSDLSSLVAKSFSYSIWNYVLITTLIKNSSVPVHFLRVSDLNSEVDNTYSESNTGLDVLF